MVGWFGIRASAANSAASLPAESEAGIRSGPPPRRRCVLAIRPVRQPAWIACRAR